MSLFKGRKENYPKPKDFYLKDTRDWAWALPPFSLNVKRATESSVVDCEPHQIPLCTTLTSSHRLWLACPPTGKVSWLFTGKIKILSLLKLIFAHSKVHLNVSFESSNCWLGTLEESEPEHCFHWVYCTESTLHLLLWSWWCVLFVASHWVELWEVFCVVLMSETLYLEPSLLVCSILTFLHTLNNVKRLWAGILEAGETIRHKCLGIIV